MINLKTKSFNPRIYRNLDIEEIISAPLTAASKANGTMAREQARFLMDFCFSKEGDNYSPVMITMTITNGVIQPGEKADDEVAIRQITTFFQVPLLTIISINSLAVETVTVDFEIEFTSQKTKNTGVDNLLSENTLAHNQRTLLLGKISYDSKERASQTSKLESRSSNSSSLKVNIQAGQLPLPLGVTTLLDLYSKSIRPVKNNNQIPEDKG